MSNVYRNKSIGLPDIFEKVANLEGTVEDKAKELLIYDSATLRWFVDVMYNAPLKDIPVPDYRPSSNPIGNDYMTIASCKSRIEWVINNKDNPMAQKNLRLVLENVHANEAKLIANLLKGEKVDDISKAVFKKAYPAFFPVNNQPTLEDFQEE